MPLDYVNQLHLSSQRASNPRQRWDHQFHSSTHFLNLDNTIDGTNNLGQRLNATFIEGMAIANPQHIIVVSKTSGYLTTLKITKKMMPKKIDGVKIKVKKMDGVIPATDLVA